jgi:hypothetical protein
MTVRCNINWDKIASKLLPDQTAYDCPNLVCRVFKLKLNKIVQEVKNGICGKCKACVTVTKLQKRGAPHAHILIWIENFDAIPLNVDSLISTELPAPDSPIYQNVGTSMMHGPCGLHNFHLSCTQNGHCGYGYPKSFSKSTIVGEDAFPSYRRQALNEGGYTFWKSIQGNQILLDNRNVVAYSPYLMRKYNCHINMEYCATIKAINHLFKYLI